jgi:hypothetical protein
VVDKGFWRGTETAPYIFVKYFRNFFECRAASPHAAKSLPHSPPARLNAQQLRSGKEELVGEKSGLISVNGYLNYPVPYGCMGFVPVAG